MRWARVVSVIVTATAISTTAMNVMPASRRARNDIVTPSTRSQGVAHAPDGVNELRLDVIDLLAEGADVCLGNATGAAEVVLPDMVEDLRLRQHPTLIDEHVAEQVVLGRRQRDVLAVTLHAMGVVVHSQVGATEHGAVALRVRCPPQHRLGARHQLVETERLLEV